MMGNDVHGSIAYFWSLGFTIMGAAIMTIIQLGCTQKGLANWVQQIVTGGIIVAAVALDRMRTTAV